MNFNLSEFLNHQLFIVLGLQWGDEGKGKIVDWLSKYVNIVARCQGGDNAGHTVKIGKHIIKLHLIPSGIMHHHITCVLGNGMVINPAKLIEEMGMLKKYLKGDLLSPDRILISHAAHIITPAEIALDNAKELTLGKKRKIGTTGRGIGPTYYHKANRSGLRTEIMFNPDQTADLVAEHIQETNKVLMKVYGLPPLKVKATALAYKKYAGLLAPYIKNTSEFLLDALVKGQKVLAEGAQGALLDIDHGTYPYVTSSNTTIGGVYSGLGIPPQKNSVTIGVVKSFCTRVGAGPFPTEMHKEDAKILRGTGENQDDEYGTTTGRPRRIGWPDLPLLKKVVEMNGVDVLVMTKLDFLNKLSQIRVCDCYENHAVVMGDMPFSMSKLENNRPLYNAEFDLNIKTDGSDINCLKKYDEAPPWLKKYLKFIQEYTKRPIMLTSVGPEREQNIEMW